MLPPDIDLRLAAIGALQDPVRRSLYLFALAQRRPVSRDEAATAVGVRRGLAAFHLDRLADEGMLAVEFRRLTGRTGPGAGRPAKLYSVGATDHELSLPPRSYAFAADLLADVVEAGRLGGSGASAEEVAEQKGRSMGQAKRSALGSRPSKARLLTTLAALLAELGYQPGTEDRTSKLRNCPFHALATTHRELVCGLNEAFLRGVLDGLGLRRLQARLDPTPSECCVVIGPIAGDES